MAAAPRRVVVIDGNTAAIRAAQQSVGGSDSGDEYALTLERLAAAEGVALRCDILRPADVDSPLPTRQQLESYDGAAITGSALNVYHEDPAVTRQVELARTVFAAGVPMFGSCWGLQVAVVAAGGSVIRNPLGREFGFARRIELNDSGRAHPMFAGKPRVFEAISVHRDTVDQLPAGSVELARNDLGLQAAEIRSGRGVCWGVQYHPEYTLGEIAATARRYATAFIEDRLFADGEDLERFVAELQALAADPGNRPIAWRHGVGPGITDASQRLAELRNWLRYAVLR